MADEDFCFRFDRSAARRAAKFQGARTLTSLRSFSAISAPNDAMAFANLPESIYNRANRRLDELQTQIHTLAAQN